MAKAAPKKQEPVKNKAKTPAPDNKAAANDDDDWFAVGEKGRQMAEEHQRQRQSENVPRFFIGTYPGSATLTIIDKEPSGFYYLEHGIKQGKSFSTYTCRKSKKHECPLCDSGNRNYAVAAYTVINHTGYTNKEGKKIQNIKQLLLCKNKVNTKLLRKKQEDAEGSLKNAVFVFHRDQQKESSVGEDITFKKHLTEKELRAVLQKSGMDAKQIEEALTPFNYPEIFAPRSEEELRRIAGIAPPAGRGDEDSLTNGITDDDDAGTEDRSLEDELGL
jgi:hypothetical protein